MINIVPCENLLPDKVTMDDLKELVDHITEEYQEVMAAWKVLQSDPDDGKAREEFGEELGDLMTMNYTTMEAVERMDATPEHFCEAVMDKIVLKNYARGYHDEYPA